MGLGEEDIRMTGTDFERTVAEASTGMQIRFGASTFVEVGKILVVRLTLNKRQAVAFLIICLQLDLMRCSEEDKIGQLCQFIGGEGGTGKSRVIEALVELFKSKEQPIRLLITATSGTAAARINGITIHFACGFSKDVAAAAHVARNVDGVRWPKAERFVDGQSRVQAARVASGFRRDPHRALLRKLSLIPAGPGAVHPPPKHGRLKPLEPQHGGEFGVPDPAAVDDAHLHKSGLPTEEEAIMMLNQGDDSAIPVPAVFMFVPEMPVVVNCNTLQRLKLVNGASYTAVEVILDKSYPGHRISSSLTIHFGPPAGTWLESETTKDFHFVGMPPGTILLTPMSVKIQYQRKRPWQQNDVRRKGLPCAAGFACTDYKVSVALELRGTRTSNVDGRVMSPLCDPYSLYVQLSRCRTLNGIMLLSKVRERVLVGNRVPEEMTEEMTAAQARLWKLSEKTVGERTWLAG
ncbi:hypothetical protein ED733_001417 [Metarhizium rileyi]|uniref:ATP-dependent DNA helicase n=1 Tax=Metarhizium rileyi (strain RCEF 4871) TaxID=1649241 RepID=A0A5C6FZX9_METRR|nr:hypothetical protein ED733_001417 [Metarhizium rileyi]